ncbi:E3 ubiquitin-protein ligase TRIM7-like [Aquarana catesbeiana]|uniref:E3 ubiquitin-protein ligase TRIM7-like n=1 Tax=Aquarana catesbeiana TaxID=8400 RepID=UPI003CC9D0E8
MAGAKLRLEVTCAICTEIYTDPVTLICGHSFCQDCITRTFKNQHDREYFCPECMQEFKRPPELKRNLRLSNIANHFHSIEPTGDKPKHACSYCVHFPVPAVTLCLHCEAFLCDVHEQTHSKSPEHLLINPTTSLEDRKCPVHKRILDYYCIVDDTRICAHCLISDHNGHKVSTISEVLQQRTKNMITVLEKLSAKREETKSMLQNLQDHKRKIDNEADGVTERVTAIMSDIRRQLEDLENRVRAEISRQQQQISLSVSSHIQQLEKEKSNLNEKITHIEEQSRNTYSMSALETQDDLFCALEDEYDLYREMGSVMIDDVGDLEKDVIFETLHSGLSNIVVGAGKDVHVKNVQGVSLSAGDDNIHIGNKNVSNKSQIEAKTQKHEPDEQVQSTSKVTATKGYNVPPIYISKNIPLIKSKFEKFTLFSGKKSNTPEMLLDVNTANNYLLISDDLKTVSRSDVHLGRPLTPERFQNPQVLSTRGISSGKHELEMEVGKVKDYRCDRFLIGMCYPSIDRRGLNFLCGDRLWGIHLERYMNLFIKNSETESLQHTSSERIKIELDYEGGQLTFYAVRDPIQHLDTFTTNFTQPLHLIISIQGSGWVKILD